MRHFCSFLIKLAFKFHLLFSLLVMKVIVLILTIFIFNDRSEIKQNNRIILVVVQVMIAVQMWWNIMSLSDIYEIYLFIHLWF